MTMQEAIKQLEDLKSHCHEWRDKDEEDSTWEKDVQALGIAIEALKKEIPKKVCWTLECYIEKWHCPACGRIYWEKEFIEDYCSSCGQRLEVSE